MLASDLKAEMAYLSELDFDSAIFVLPRCCKLLYMFNQNVKPLSINENVKPLFNLKRNPFRNGDDMTKDNKKLQGASWVAVRRVCEIRWSS